MPKEKIFIFLSFWITIVFLFSLFAYAWQEPTTNPPGGNVPAPINTGSSGQYKIGRFQIGNSATDWINDSISGFSEPVVSNDGFVFIGGYTGTEDSDLRLYILDNANDRVSIWGDSCGGGNCGELNAARLAHYFTAGGDAWHKGKMTAAAICLEGKGCKSDWSDIAGASYWTLSDTKLYPNNTGWNVGIGTTSPGAKLDVAGQVRANSIYVNVGEGLEIENGGSSYGPNDSRRINLRDGNPPTDGALVITSDVSSPSDAGNLIAYFDRNKSAFLGNVGIGTTSPNGKLQIQENGVLSATDGNVVLYHPSSGSYSSIVFPSRVNYGSDYGYIAYYDDNNNYDYWGGSSENSALVIGVQNDGRNSVSDVVVLKSPASVIVDAPELRAPIIYDSNDTGYYVNPNSTSRLYRIDGNYFYYASDISLKKDIKPISNALDKVLQLQGVRFNWKDTNKPSIGLISQDVEKIFPEIVSTDEQGLKSIEYAKLVAPLIEALKEQQKEIEELKAEIEELKLKIK